jgi:hypothetical protein
LPVALFEGLSCYLMLSGLDRDSSGLLLRYFRGYYWHSPYRQVIQFDLECSIYDPELFYRLKPGPCSHSGLRFKNAYSINSLGVRDDEESLAAPEVICIGDSHTMGWGVDQQDTYSQLIERQSGRRVLNMGMSSYGTAREMILLGRADLSRLKVLVVQYNDNDLPENLKYLKDGGRLEIRPLQVWQRFAGLERGRQYFPGRHFLGLLRSAFRLLERNEREMMRPDKAFGARAHAAAFLAVLSSFDRPELQKAQLVVFDLRNEHSAESAVELSFAEALAAMKSSGRFQALASRLVVLDLSSGLDRPECRQVIDNHINEAGHRLIAERVLERLGRKE